MYARKLLYHWAVSSALTHWFMKQETSLGGCQMTSGGLSLWRWLIPIHGHLAASHLPTLHKPTPLVKVSPAVGAAVLRDGPLTHILVLQRSTWEEMTSVIWTNNPLSFSTKLVASVLDYRNVKQTHSSWTKLFHCYCRDPRYSDTVF